jgi:hypothetical protein
MAARAVACQHVQTQQRPRERAHRVSAPARGPTCTTPATEARRTPSRTYVPWPRRKPASALMVCSQQPGRGPARTRVNADGQAGSRAQQGCAPPGAVPHARRRPARVRARAPTPGPPVLRALGPRLSAHHTRPRQQRAGCAARHTGACDRPTCPGVTSSIAARQRHQSHKCSNTPKFVAGISESRQWAVVNTVFYQVK